MGVCVTVTVIVGCVCDCVWEVRVCICGGGGSVHACEQFSQGSDPWAQSRQETQAPAELKRPRGCGGSVHSPSDRSHPRLPTCLAKQRGVDAMVFISRQISPRDWPCFCVTGGERGPGSPFSFASVSSPPSGPPPLPSPRTSSFPRVGKPSMEAESCLLLFWSSWSFPPLLTLDV